MKFKKMHPDAQLPVQKNTGDAGYDLHSVEDAWVADLAKIDTGVAVAIPQGHVGVVLDRSGNAAKFGLHTLAGCIDSGYRGNLQVLLTCVKPEAHQVKKGDRIAQLVILPCVMEASEFVDELSDTERGDKGFGSSGR